MEHEREVLTLRATAAARFCLRSPDVSTYMNHHHHMREGVKTKCRLSPHASFSRLLSSCPQGLHSILLQDCGTHWGLPLVPGPLQAQTALVFLPLHGPPAKAGFLPLVCVVL